MIFKTTAPARGWSVAGLAAMLSLALALSGCESVTELIEGPPPPPPCPTIEFLADADTLTRFRSGEGRDLTDVLFSASMDRFQGACEYDLDRDTRNGTLSVEIEVAFSVKRGPAETQSMIDLPYFVTITDQGRNVLNKGTFTSRVAFPGNQTAVTVIDPPVHLTFPITDSRRGKDYKIYLGLQLSHQELNYNREVKAARQAR